MQVTPGYAGGETINPSYEEVCSGKTGHAEVVEVVYDEKRVSLEKILLVFFEIHNPTTLNRQGNDVGTQYRSIILFEEEKDKIEIVKSIKKAQQKYSEKIVTEYKKLNKFYPAEENHKDYYENNKNQPYCKLVIKPKLDKLTLKPEK
jgi:methionine-S-sulfoxide reductase